MLFSYLHISFELIKKKRISQTIVSVTPYKRNTQKLENSLQYNCHPNPLKQSENYEKYFSKRLLNQNNTSTFCSEIHKVLT